MISRPLDKHSITTSVALLLLLAAGWFIFEPGLSGEFMLDDFHNLAALERGVNDLEGLKHYLATNNAGPLGRPISKLSFLLDDNNWPSTPDNFKRTNLLIHLLAGLLVFVTLRLLAQTRMTVKTADWLALAATALWLVHPLQASTVLYVVQRMTQLSTLFVMAGVASHVFMRLRFATPDYRHLLGFSVSIALFTILAMFSKESGALLPVFILVTEFTLLAHLSAPRLYRVWRRLAVITPSAVIAAYIIYLPNWINSYGRRDYTLYERLLTQPIVLWDYLGSFFTMKTEGLGLFQEDYPVYSTLLDAKVLTGLISLVGIVAIALWFKKRFAIACFAILWFFAGHLIESTSVPLEVYFEHRNYLPLVGPAFALVYCLYAGIAFVVTDLKKLPIAAVCLLIGVAGSITYDYATAWGTPAKLLPTWAAEHPNSARAQRAFAQIQAKAGYPLAAMDTLDAAYERIPYDLSLPLMSTMLSCAFDKPLRYDLAVLEKTADEHRWTDYLRGVAENFGEFIHETACASQSPQVAAILGKTRSYLEKGAPLAELVSLQITAGKMMLKAERFDDASKHFHAADEMAPSAVSARRLGGAYFANGNFIAARKMVTVARERDSHKDDDEESGDTRSDYYNRVLNIIDQKLADEN